MSTDDDRRTIYNALEHSIGPHPAALLMAQLPPVGWAELATKHDLAGVRGEMAELRGEMAELRAELRGEMAELRAEVHSQVPKFIAANIASLLALAGLVVGAASLLR